MIGRSPYFPEPNEFVLADDCAEYLLERDLMRLPAKLVYGGQEKELGVALQCRSQSRDSIKGELRGAGLKHRQHVGLSEARFGRYLRLALSRSKLLDPAIEVFYQPGVNKGSTCGFCHLARLSASQRQRC
jgi:hypothetical protein